MPKAVLSKTLTASGRLEAYLEQETWMPSPFLMEINEGVSGRVLNFCLGTEAVRSSGLEVYPCRLLS